MNRRGPAAAAIATVVAALITTWPMAQNPIDRALGDPALEAVDHAWALAAALRDGPLQLHTNLLNFPDGYTWVLADPLNLLPFAIGNVLGGPALALNLVHLANLLLVGAGAAALCRWVGPEERAPRWFAAATAVCAAPFAGGLVTGMTDAQGMGLVALALAALPTAVRMGGRRIVWAGLTLGLCAWAGPYPALYGAALAVVVGLLAVWQVRPLSARVALARLVGVAGVALAMAAPVVAATAGRAAHLPGAASITGAVLSNPDAPENRALGGDLVGLLWPGLATDPLHSVTLGLPIVLLAALGLTRRAGPRALALIAGICGVGALGFTLQAAGASVSVGGQPLLMPAGAASLAIDALGRAPRWYRLAMLTALALAPLAAAGAARLAAKSPSPPTLMAGLVALVIGANVPLGGVPWPRPTLAAPPPTALATLPPGALVHLPPLRSAGAPGPNGLRHPELWAQITHGRPMVGNPHQSGGFTAPGPAREAQRALMAAALAGNAGDTQRAADALVELGITVLVHHPRRSPEKITQALASALGPPTLDEDGLHAWALGPSP